MGLDAYDVVGDVAEGWPDCSQHDEVELSVLLTEVLVKWAEEKIGDPTFFAVEDIEQHNPAPESALPESSGGILNG